MPPAGPLIALLTARFSHASWKISPSLSPLHVHLLLTELLTRVLDDLVASISAHVLGRVVDVAARAVPEFVVCGLGFGRLLGSPRHCCVRGSGLRSCLGVGFVRE